jgi:hypothetical protein
MFENLQETCVLSLSGEFYGAVFDDEKITVQVKKNRACKATLKRERTTFVLLTTPQRRTFLIRHFSCNSHES